MFKALNNEVNGLRLLITYWFTISNRHSLAVIMKKFRDSYQTQMKHGKLPINSPAINFHLWHISIDCSAFRETHKQWQWSGAAALEANNSNQKLTRTTDTFFVPAWPAESAKTNKQTNMKLQRQTTKGKHQQIDMWVYRLARIVFCCGQTENFNIDTSRGRFP